MPAIPPPPTITKGFWARAFLASLKVVPTRENMIAVMAWINFEGTSAAWNPLATTLPWPGATNFNSVGVKNYRTMADGIAASVTTLRSPLHGYPRIVVNLLASSKAEATCAAVTASSWGSKPSAEMAASVRARYDFELQTPLLAATKSSGIIGPIAKGVAAPFHVAGKVVHGAGQAVHGIDAIARLFTAHNFLRLGEIIAGGGLLFVGALGAGKVFVGVGPDASDVAALLNPSKAVASVTSSRTRTTPARPDLIRDSGVLEERRATVQRLRESSSRRSTSGPRTVTDRGEARRIIEEANARGERVRAR